METENVTTDAVIDHVLFTFVDDAGDQWIVTGYKDVVAHDGEDWEVFTSGRLDRDAIATSIRVTFVFPEYPSTPRLERETIHDHGQYMHVIPAGEQYCVPVHHPNVTVTIQRA